MNLQEAVAQCANFAPVPSSKLCIVGEQLERAKVNDELDLMQNILGNYSQDKAAVILTKGGYSVGSSAIGRHKSESCRCYR